MLPRNGLIAPLAPLVLLALPALPVRAADPPSGSWVWGDPHAHSGWSFDGCEDPEARCAPRGALPAEDFFENAAAAELDFAAITDHAEADRWGPDGEEGELWDIWEGQAAVVRAAEGGSVLPLLGYEWTGYRSDERSGHPRGSHRTVLLRDADACVPRRVAGFAISGGERVSLDGVAVYLQEDDDAYVSVVGELWDALDEAEASCGPTGWISFAHHPAYEMPQVTDWSLDENAPDRETLVEIASEHGSSECLDITQDGCGFRVNEDQGYWPDGSVQRALDRGYRLGFVGGTDSHDARPGSLEDGAGWVGQEDGAGEVIQQFMPGALTGVFLEEGASLDGDALFDALERRHTLASSGPRPALLAWVESADGEIWLPGEIVPEDAGPLEIVLELGDAEEGYALAQVDRLGPGGVIEDASSEPALRFGWEPELGDWTYLRLRYTSATAADGEERVWISPWFFAETKEGGRCSGCAAGASSPRSWPVAALPMLVGLCLWRRRERPADRTPRPRRGGRPAR